MMPPTHARNTGKGQRGYTVITVALSITVLLAITALAVDMGMVYTARTHSQHVADGAALAAAYTFLNDAAPQPATAQQAAIAAASSNEVLGQSIALTADDVVVDLPNRRVTVTVNRLGADAVVTNFAAVVGATSVALRARATAQCAPNAANGGSRCIKPLYVPNTAISPNPTATACANGEEIFNPATQALTPYAQAYFSTDPAARLLRPTSSNAAVAPGQYYSLDFGSGGQDYRCTIAQCVNQCGGSSAIRCGNSYPLKTGNMVGPTTQGFNDLIGNPPEDEWVSSGRYRQISSGIVKDSSQALVSVPVWDSCSQPIGPGTAGQSLQVIGFVTMFVANVVQSGGNRGDTTAYFVSATDCQADAGGGNNNGEANGPTGPFARPIQLVQNPQSH